MKKKQTEIAKKLGISDASFSKWIRGLCRLDPSVALAISHGYRLNLSVMLSKDGERIVEMLEKRFGKFRKKAGGSAKSLHV